MISIGTRYIIVSIGHTAAGKTTILRSIANHFGFVFISEGAIKRSLVSNYQNSCSVDEVLRSRGYQLAIAKAVDELNKSSSTAVVLDASFHKLFRRLWVYDEIRKTFDDRIHVIWIHCQCPDRSIVEERIHQRAISSIRTADNQADKMFIYDYIMREFDSVKIEDYPIDNVTSSIISIDTDKNRVTSLSTQAPKDPMLEDLVKYIEQDYLPSMNN